MPSFNPFGAGEAAAGAGIVELIKLLAEDRRNFEQVFKDTLAKQLKARGNYNRTIVNRTLDSLVGDSEIECWLDGAQLPEDLPLLEALAGKLKLDVSLLHDFFLAFEHAIAKNPTLNTILQNRRAASSTQYLRDILETLSGQPTETQIRNHLAAVQRYREKIRQNFSTIMLFGERKREDDSVFSRMSNIQTGFIPLHLRPWHDDASEAVREDDDAAPLAMDEIFLHKRERLILIRGLPGSGKTTLLRHFTWKLASDGPHHPAIPIYLRLKNLDFGKKSLDDFIRQGVKKLCPNLPTQKVLLAENYFLEPPMVVLLDGVDEIEDADSHAGFAEALRELAQDYPRCNIIVASRPLGLDKNDYPEFAALDLDRLTPELIADYLDRWFGDDENKIKALQRTLDDKPRMYALAENPFLLSMICYTYDQGGDTALIERRSDLYKNCTDSLLRRAYDPESATKLKIDMASTLAVLKDLSLRFFLWQEADFPVDHVNVMGQRVLTAESIGKTENFLDRVQRETGLIQRAAEGFTFVHRSLWEYFTALALRDDKTKKNKFVIRHAANPDWEEVVRLYAGLLANKEHVKKLVHGLWQINRPLALRVTTEITTPAADLLKPLIQQEDGNQGKLLLIDGLAQSLPLIDESNRANLVEETLKILLIDCEEKDCQVIYHAQMLLEKLGLRPLAPGGLLYDLFDLEHALENQQKLLSDPENLFEWIEVEGDIFRRGDDEHEPNERPVRQVKVSSFRLTKHPVTNRMLASFPFGEKFPNYGGDSNPAIGNTWFEAYYFCLWIGCRLPTEAEWEYAARGGKKMVAQGMQYYFEGGEDELPNHAWFGDTTRREAHAVDEPNPHTGKENLNPLGLANILGNVWEWCADWYGNYKQPENPDEVLENPQGPPTGTERVLRGGAWSYDPYVLRCAYRNRNDPTSRGNGIGFRCAQDSR